ncbi:hypothetical protein HID58_093226 [Brassica napus]|uniref:RRM domain-containing protein n=1 Tax=Brassica napus TaxID=3708 RepID=A0ABQ7XE99_BRANA|nr:hypothetical protein HID58_093226 [Brassica napus]
MWSATLAFPSLVASSTSLSCYRNRRLLKIQASLSNYPLASKIMICRFRQVKIFYKRSFQLFGEIAEVKLVKDESMKRSKGFAFIQFTSQDDAFLAIETMDRRMYNGRMIYIDIAKPGKLDFQQQPRTSGPPEKLQVPEEPANNEVADCWY